ncbi:uncharacterized protein [Hyperolius riggenbachi]|uniref:uncharacterized protein isoform X2 n=1 Tax=Hyperolius riggenbachi TaxID=752182 RepID=UPI0035A2CBB7
MMKEGQYMEGPLRDTMTENQPPVTSPDGFSNTNPPENCTGPLYSQDCPQKDHTIPHHNQSGDLFDLKIKIKEEEEETYVWSDQQPMEEGDMMETIKVEELEMYVWSDQQPVEEGDMMGTNKEEEEETYVRSDQQSMEEGDMMGTIKEEELEMYVWSDQQSTEEADFMVTPKEENMPLNIGADGSRIPSERCTSPLYFENVPQEDHNYAHGHIVTEKEKSNFILSGKKWFTTAELIAKVQMHPEFYDKRNPGYKDTARNNLVWADIAAEFAENIWDELSEKDKAEKIEQLKKRWKSVRDNYRRELDKQISEERSGARATNRRKYKFTAFLEFLRTYHKSVPG